MTSGLASPTSHLLGPAMATSSGGMAVEGNVKGGACWQEEDVHIVLESQCEVQGRIGTASVG